MIKKKLPLQIIVTIDVEDFFEPRSEIETYRGLIGNEAWGTSKIMEIIERHGGRGTFFVDVYNRRTVSENIVSKCVEEIHRRDHEVGLHTHPGFPDGKRGYGMMQTLLRLSLEEQTAFIAKGVELLVKWIGSPPKSHRAGGYGANYDTLKALSSNSIYIDSSVYSGYQFCGLNEPPLTVNAPVNCSNVTEIPVTINRIELALGPVKIFSMKKKLDPDWCGPGELKRLIDTSVGAGINPIVLFLHSYSMIDIENGFQPNPSAVEALDNILEYAVRRHGAELITMADSAKTLGELPSFDSTPPPRTKFDLLFHDRALAWWLLRTIRLRHIRAAFGLS